MRQTTNKQKMRTWNVGGKTECLTPEKEVRKIIMKLPVDTHVINNCFSSQLYLSSDDLKIALHNKHYMDRKSTEVHGGNSESKWKGRVETTSNTWLGVNKEMLENTTLAWHRLYTGSLPFQTRRCE